MSVANSIPVSAELYREVAQQANQTGVSPQEWAAMVLADRVYLERQTEEFFNRRAENSSCKSLGELLDKAPNVPPDPGDDFRS